MDCDEPRPAPNEKMQPIQWTERPTGALEAAGSLWPGYNGCPSHHRFPQAKLIFPLDLPNKHQPFSSSP
jgi:hypothetical protein